MVAITLEGPSDLIRRIYDEVSVQDVLVSEPIVADSPVDMLNAPIGGDEVRQFLEVLTVAATTGTAIATFVDKVLAIVRESKGQLSIKDSASGKKIASITEENDVQSIKGLIPE